MRMQSLLGGAGLCFAGLIASSASAGVLVNTVGIDGSGNVTSVTIDGALTPVGELVPVAELTKVNISNYLVADGGVVPAAGSRATAITDDNVLTGLANLTTTADSTNLRFASPVLNGPGGDILLFEFGTATGGSDEEWRLTTKSGGFFDIDVEDAVNGYLTPGFNFDLYQGSPVPSTLANLENAVFTLSNGNLNGFRVSVILIDLSDLGYAEGESITTLGIATSGNLASTGAANNGARADLVAAYGLATIPEPATVSLLVVGGMMLSSRRSR